MIIPNMALSICLKKLLYSYCAAVFTNPGTERFPNDYTAGAILFFFLKLKAHINYLDANIL